MSMNSFHARTTRPPKKPAVRASAPAGIRVDALLVQQGLAPSRSAAQRLIAAGRVRANKVGAGETAPLLKPAQLLPAETVLQVSAEPDQANQGSSTNPP